MEDVIYELTNKGRLFRARTRLIEALRDIQDDRLHTAHEAVEEAARLIEEVKNSGN